LFFFFNNDRFLRIESGNGKRYDEAEVK